MTPQNQPGLVTGVWGLLFELCPFPRWSHWHFLVVDQICGKGELGGLLEKHNKVFRSPQRHCCGHRRSSTEADQRPSEQRSLHCGHHPASAASWPCCWLGGVKGQAQSRVTPTGNGRDHADVTLFLNH